MNKRGDTQWYLIGFILAVIVLMVIAFGFFYPKQKALSQETDKLVDITKVDTDFLNIKSFTSQEKEKCAKFTNINNCMGVNAQKTGCFWGKTTSGIGCYACTNKKYFGDNFGKCQGYLSLFQTEAKLDGNRLFVSDFNQFTDIQEKLGLLCDFNPCDFINNNNINKCQKVAILPSKEAAEPVYSLSCS